MADTARDTLIFGPDLVVRKEAFRSLRALIFSSPDQESLDLETLDGIKLSRDVLKAALIALPAMGPRRLVRVINAEKLEKSALETLIAFLKTPHPHVVVLLEAEHWDIATAARQELDPLLAKVGVEPPEGANVFDMMRPVMAGNALAGLRALKALFEGGEEPERLLGGMLWAWTNKGRVSVDVRKKGLLLLQEADRALKRSRFSRRETALEVLVVKLSLLTR